MEQWVAKSDNWVLVNYFITAGTFSSRIHSFSFDLFVSLIDLNVLDNKKEIWIRKKEMKKKREKCLFPLFCPSFYRKWVR